MSVIECLPNDAVQAPGTHHRADKCAGVAVNTKGKRQAGAPKGTSSCSLHSPRVQGRSLGGDRGAAKYLNATQT